jgi:hypothetical protein
LEEINRDVLEADFWTIVECGSYILKRQMSAVCALNALSGRPDVGRSMYRLVLTRTKFEILGKCPTRAGFGKLTFSTQVLRGIIGVLSKGWS